MSSWLKRNKLKILERCVMVRYLAEMNTLTMIYF